MNKEIAQKLIDKIGLEKAKDIVKNCPADCDIYRENIGSVVVFEISIGVLKTALMLLGHDQSQNNLDGWVNIKERLPNKDGKYLVHYQTQVLCDGRYLPKFDVVNFSLCINRFDFYHDHITHWQPLPNPPKQKEQQ